MLEVPLSKDCDCGLRRESKMVSADSTSQVCCFEQKTDRISGLGELALCREEGQSRGTGKGKEFTNTRKGHQWNMFSHERAKDRSVSKEEDQAFPLEKTVEIGRSKREKM